MEELKQSNDEEQRCMIEIVIILSPTILPISSRRNADVVNQSHRACVTFWLLSVVCLCLLFVLGCQRKNETTQDLQPIPHPDISLLDSDANFPVSKQKSLEDATATGADQQRAQAWGQLGMLYHAFHLYGPALACYENAGQLATDNANHRWRYLAGLVHQQLGAQDEAMLAFSESIANGENAAALVKLGELEFLNNQLDRARELFEQAYRSEKNVTAALVGLGKVAARQEQYERAVDFYQEALQRQPGATSVHYLLATAHRELGEMDKFQFHMARHGDGQPILTDSILAEVENLRDDGEALRNKGNQLAGAKRYSEALSYYQRALAAEPQDVRTLINVGACYQGLEDAKNAVETYKKVLAHSTLPNLTATAHFRLGDLFEGQGGQSLAHYHAALKLNPDIPSYVFRYAESLRAIKRFEEALPYYEQTLHDKPDFHVARLGRALVLIKLGRWSQARTHLEKDVKAVPSQQVFVQFLVRVLAASPDDTVRDGARALELAESSPTVQGPEPLATYAMALAENQRFDEAARHQQQAIKLARERRSTQAQHLAQQLHDYSQGKPCRMPFPPKATIFQRKNY